MSKLDMHSVTLKVKGHSGLASFYWHRLWYLWLGKIHPSYNDKQ